VSFIIFSLSRFQLPHYLNILFPFFSILTAGYLLQLHRRRTQKIIGVIQQVVTLLLPLLLLFLTVLFHFRGWPFIAGSIVVLSLLSFRTFRGGELPDVTARCFWAALLAYTFINFCLYPAILKYQAGTEAGNYVSKLKAPVVYMPEETPANYSFEFYSRPSVRRIPVSGLRLVAEAGPALVFLPTTYTDSLLQKGWQVTEIKRFPNFHISQLTGEFLNYKTRSSTLEWYSLVSIHAAVPDHGRLPVSPGVQGP
jgi:4-amino-4-deoxy-L-arabinose transferase-like glycosyltransferase